MPDTITAPVALGMALKSVGVTITDEQAEGAIRSLEFNRWHLLCGESLNDVLDEIDQAAIAEGR